MRDVLLPNLDCRAYCMAMVLTPAFYTADMVRALPDDGQRYELVWGELLVTPAPRGWHQELAGRLFFLLTEYCRRSGSAKVLFSPADISWSDDTLVQPDVFVFPKSEGKDYQWTSIQTLLLVAEVLSPSTARHDRFNKRRLYQERNVPVLWLVDGESNHVEVWSPGARFPTIERNELRWQPDEATAPLVIDLEQFFSRE